MVEAQEGTVDVDDGLDNTTQSYTIHVDKEKAAEYGMTTAQVFQLVYAKLASQTAVTAISAGVQDYEVYVRSEEQANVTLDDIKNLTFSYEDKMAQLSSTVATGRKRRTKNCRRIPRIQGMPRISKTQKIPGIPGIR